MSNVALEVVNLQKTYGGRRRWFRKTAPFWALRSVSVAVGEGDTLAIVGESGSGKSTLGRIMAGVLPWDSGSVKVHQEVMNPRDTTDAARSLRRSIQLVHQDPFAALNPSQTVAAILRYAIEVSRLKGREAVLARTRDLLTDVGLTPPERYWNKYPYQLSGGQRQRIVIARALAVDPKVLIADEAVSMIDVSMRQNILEIMRTIQEQQGLAIVFITHDLALARNFAQRGRTIVMYAGTIIESGATEAVIQDPHHPYTAMLRDAVPEPDPDVPLGALVPLPAGPPDMHWLAPGCRFAPRCPYASAQCDRETPDLALVGDNHWVACHHAHEWMLNLEHSTIAR